MPRGSLVVGRIQSGVFVPAPVEVMRLTLRVGNEDDLWQRIGQSAQPRLVGGQLLLRLGALHGFPAARRNQADQLDLGGQPAPRCALMHADGRDQAAVFVQRNRQRRAQAGAAVLLRHVVRCAGRHRIGGEPGAILQQGVAQALCHFQRKIALQARHVLHMVADHVHGSTVGRRQAERAAIDLQMLAQQAHAGIDDLTRIGNVLQRVFEHQQETVATCHAALLGDIESVHQDRVNAAVALAHRLIQEIHEGLIERIAGRALQIGGHRLADEGAAAAPHLIEQLEIALVCDFRHRLEQRTAEQRSLADQLVEALVRALDDVAGSPQHRHEGRRLVERRRHRCGRGLATGRPCSRGGRAGDIQHAQRFAGLQHRAAGPRRQRQCCTRIGIAVVGFSAVCKFREGLAECCRVAFTQQRGAGIVVDAARLLAPDQQHWRLCMQAQRKRRAQRWAVA
ncbi:hypothetical protein LMG19144_02278 [Xanthomonas arboricola pv. fragariae]|nr:hypothetical protein LMG19144_02278 [Xanthomonas arboricola pv. fragariae]